MADSAAQLCSILHCLDFCVSVTAYQHYCACAAWQWHHECHVTCVTVAHTTIKWQVTCCRLMQVHKQALSFPGSARSKSTSKPWLSAISICQRSSVLAGTATCPRLYTRYHYIRHLALAGKRFHYYYYDYIRSSQIPKPKGFIQHYSLTFVLQGMHNLQR